MCNRMRALPAAPNGPAVQVCATSAGSELSRQVPVDLEPDADLNEGRGCPGHWLSSLAFPSGNKFDRGTHASPPPQGRTLTHQGNSIAARPWGTGQPNENFPTHPLSLEIIYYLPN